MALCYTSVTVSQFAQEGSTAQSAQVPHSPTSATSATLATSATSATLATLATSHEKQSELHWPADRLVKSLSHIIMMVKMSLSMVLFLLALAII